jgi:hypothetical protein
VFADWLKLCYYGGVEDLHALTTSVRIQCGLDVSFEFFFKIFKVKYAQKPNFEERCCTCEQGIKICIIQE